MGSAHAAPLGVLKPRGITHGFWNLGNPPVRYVATSTQDGGGTKIRQAIQQHLP